MANIKRIKLPDDAQVRKIYDDGALRYDSTNNLTAEQKESILRDLGLDGTDTPVNWDDIEDKPVATTSANGLMSAEDKSKANYTNIAYGTCSTAAGTAAKVVTVSGNTNWDLTAGSIICITFSAINTASNPTLNVNGTGAKSISYNGAVITTSSLNRGGHTIPQMYIYDGTNYVWIGHSTDWNTTYPISIKSATTAATAGWYRIATSSSGISNCSGIFQITAAVSGAHTIATLIADTSYGLALGTNIKVLSCSNWSTPALTKARIVYNPTYSGNYAYLEVYLSSAKAMPIRVNMYGNTGWTLVAPSTAGSIPSGYSSKEVNLEQSGGGKANYTASITTTWSGSAAPYTQSITVTGITADDKPIVDVTMSGTYATDQTRLEEWGKIYRIVTAANKITVYATAKTTVALPIQLQVVR